MKTQVRLLIEQADLHCLAVCFCMSLTTHLSNERPTYLNFQVIKRSILDFEKFRMLTVLTEGLIDCCGEFDSVLEDGWTGGSRK